MESILEYTQTLEKSLKETITTLIETMKKEQLTKGYETIEHMYDISGIPNIKYSPCIMIPGPLHTSFYCVPCKLPDDEFVIYSNSSHSNENNNRIVYTCGIITNYGRFLLSLPVYNPISGGNCPSYYTPISSTAVQCTSIYGRQGNEKSIEVLQPLPYKVPKLVFDMFKIMSGCLIDKSTEYTSKLQELNGEFYNLLGKWQEYIQPHVGLDIQNFPKQVEEFKEEIQTLKQEKADLEEQLKRLQQQHTALTEANTNLGRQYSEISDANQWKTMFVEHLKKTFKKETYADSKGALLPKEKIKDLLSRFTYISHAELRKLLDENKEAQEFFQYQKMHQKFKGITELQQGQKYMNDNLEGLRGDLRTQREE